MAAWLALCRRSRFGAHIVAWNGYLRPAACFLWTTGHSQSVHSFCRGSQVICLSKMAKAVSTYCTLSRHMHVSAAPLRSTYKSKEGFSDDALQLIHADLQRLCDDIKNDLVCINPGLREITHYYFDGKGKAFRPTLVLLMARSCNATCGNSREVTMAQRTIARIAEMIHTASLIHDDIIDQADTRRGKLVASRIWGERKAILAGDFILSTASVALARLGNEHVISMVAQVVEDLVRGEFMQLGSKENENERFAHYLLKTFKKTASLMAHSCKAVAVLGNSSVAVQETAYLFGKNVGMAFQLIDDLLDFTACTNQIGKPTAADLRLGLATCPVLFACEKYPELHSMIMRRFGHTGDVEKAWNYVFESDGVQQTRALAERYCKEAAKTVQRLHDSPEREALIRLTDLLLTRKK